MQHKMIKLLLIMTLFALQGFSQAPDKSDHPLLDKYYPRAQKTVDTAKAKPAPEFAPAPETNPIPVAKPAATATTAPAIVKPATNVPEPIIKPLAETTPPSTGTAAPVVTTSSNTTATEPGTKLISETKAPEPVIDTTAAVKPAAVVVQPPPVQPVKKVQPQGPPPTPYIDTRLGSSSPLYDTYQKNSDGAGSVTTRPK